MSKLPCGCLLLSIIIKSTWTPPFLKLQGLEDGVSSSGIVKLIFLEGGAGSFPRVASALQAETLAVLRSLQRAAELEMTRLVIETDAATVGRALRSTDLDRSPNGCLFSQIREFMMSQFIHCFVSVCPRSCNMVADSLVGHGCTLEEGSCMYMSHAPDFVLALVSGDLPRASE
ncbi:hypothetical protein C2845_PM09G13770 [Panicum miliaceum]|uniref:RNase H type-1 domain-containing protein n=1 Tax=Panicum miliaceum TaxID=4540 RepID=A0A3L6S2B3_PANMI|nr:hypothetical protein C2845_PM09G13770 [Panicum miliaceum]